MARKSIFKTSYFGESRLFTRSSWWLGIISVTGGYFTPAPVLISRFRGLSWMGLGLTPVGVGLEVCVGVVVVTMIKGEYTSSCVPLSYRTIL